MEENNTQAKDIAEERWAEVGRDPNDDLIIGYADSEEFIAHVYCDEQGALIAQAPRMLAALEEAEVEYTHGGYRISMETLTEMRAVIAAARGKA